MRTTINLDDDVLEQVKQYADSRSLALGRAASDLIRRGLNAPLQTQVVNGFHVVVLPEGSPSLTTERVKTLLDEEL
jgi:negative regulator of replication initiation